MKWLARLAIALFWMFSAVAVHADDCSKPKSMADIKTLVSGLGYDVSDENGIIKITINSGTYNFPVYFSITGDQSYLIVFTVLENLPEDKVAKMPAVAMLQFNDTHFNYLTLNKYQDHLRFLMQNTIPPGTATPQVLRSIVTHLIEDASAAEPLWSSAKWN